MRIFVYKEYTNNEIAKKKKIQEKNKEHWNSDSYSE